MTSALTADCGIIFEPDKKRTHSNRLKLCKLAVDKYSESDSELLQISVIHVHEFIFPIERMRISAQIKNVIYK